MNKTRFVIAGFAAAAFAIAVAFFWKKNATDAEESTVSPRLQVITFAARNGGGASSAASSVAAVPVSLIPLEKDEILVQTLAADLDGDGYDEQIYALRRGANPEITLLVGLYAPAEDAYIRAAEISTGVTRAFSYSVTDLAGEHWNALVYSGQTPEGDTIMRLLAARQEDGHFAFETVGDFRSDDAIFIQQLERHESYSLSQAPGASFPVQTSSSDPDAGQPLARIQTLYDWDSPSRRYVPVKQERTTGTAVAEAELQHGTAEDFAQFLYGLWLQTGEPDGESRAVFFDYAAREIIFLNGESETAYRWGESVRNRNGLRFSVQNALLPTLTRRLDISLSGADEITVRGQDDARMAVGTRAPWNGAYKKTGKQTAPVLPAETPDVDALAALCSRERWLLSGGRSVRFSGAEYQAFAAATTENAAEVSNAAVDSGRVAAFSFGGETVLQFRSAAKKPFFGAAYLVSKTEEADGTDFVGGYMLEPVALTRDGYARISAPPVFLRQ
jgi:hypothetical protein